MAHPGFCDFEGCSELASVDYYDCFMCRATMCPAHILKAAKDHPCPIDRKDMSSKLWDIRDCHMADKYKHIADLIELEIKPAAAVLRPDIPFTVLVPSGDNADEFLYITGCANILVPFTFADGVKWFARMYIHLQITFGEAGALMRASEVATIQTVYALAPEFVPAAHIASTQNVHSLSFFFHEAAVGTRFERWPKISAEQGHRQLVKDFALFMTKMATKQYSGVGSLTFDAHGNIVVGPLLARHFKVTQGAKLGVYSTSVECKLARIAHLLRLVREKRMEWDGRWSTRERDPVWAYDVLLGAQELVRGCDDMNRQEPTYIRHMGDHVGQFLMAEDGHLDAVVDWEYAATLPFAEAFNAPMMFFRDLPRPGNKLMKHRNNDLLPFEIQLLQELLALGRKDMADAVAGGRKYHRLDEAMWGYQTFEAAAGLRLAFNPNASVPSSKEEWIKEAMVKYADDKELQQLAAEWEVVKKAAAEAALKEEAEKRAAEEVASGDKAENVEPASSNTTKDKISPQATTSSSEATAVTIASKAEATAMLKNEGSLVEATTTVTLTMTGDKATIQPVGGCRAVEKAVESLAIKA